MTRRHHHPARSSSIIATLVLTCLSTGCGNPAAAEWGIVGDSLTGTGTSSTYPARLMSELNLEPAALIVDGRGGRPAKGGAESVRALIATYPNLHSLIFFLGGADIVDFVAEADPDLTRNLDDPADGIAGELAAVLDAVSIDIAEALDHAADAGVAVWVVTYPPLPARDLPCLAFGGARLSGTDAVRAQRYVAELNVMLRAQADRAGARVIDLEVVDPLGADARNYADCLHPSAAGAERMGEAMAQIILALR